MQFCMYRYSFSFGLTGLAMPNWTVWIIWWGHKVVHKHASVASL